MNRISRVFIFLALFGVLLVLIFYCYKCYSLLNLAKLNVHYSYFLIPCLEIRLCFFDVV